MKIGVLQFSRKSDPLPGPKREGRLTALFSEGSIRSYPSLGPLEGNPIKALIDMMLRENAYVNVHTEQHPDEEIRGQIIDP